MGYFQQLGSKRLNGGEAGGRGGSRGVEIHQESELGLLWSEGAETDLGIKFRAPRLQPEQGFRNLTSPQSVTRVGGQ